MSFIFRYHHILPFLKIGRYKMFLL